MKEEQCPYCFKYFCIPEKVYMHTANYGGAIVNFKCVHCEMVINAIAEREVNIFCLTQTANDSDW